MSYRIKCLALVVFLFAHFSNESFAQSEISLQQRCEELSSETSYKYEIVSGTVLNAGITNYSPLDCVTAECSESLWRKRSKAYFFALLEGRGFNSRIKKFRIATPDEDRATISKKKLYMTTGKSYEFCARRDETNPKLQNYRFYWIDNVGTISEIKSAKIDKKQQ